MQMRSSAAASAPADLVMLSAIRRQLAPTAATLVAGTGTAGDTAAAAPRPLGCVEMRTYFAAAGKLEALHSRFRDNTCRLFAKHGIASHGPESHFAAGHST